MQNLACHLRMYGKENCHVNSWLIFQKACHIHNWCRSSWRKTSWHLYWAGRVIKSVKVKKIHYCAHYNNGNDIQEAEKEALKKIQWKIIECTLKIKIWIQETQLFLLHQNFSKEKKRSFVSAHLDSNYSQKQSMKKKKHNYLVVEEC